MYRVNWILFLVSRSNKQEIVKQLSFYHQEIQCRADHITWENGHYHLIHNNDGKTLSWDGLLRKFIIFVTPFRDVNKNCYTRFIYTLVKKIVQELFLFSSQCICNLQSIHQSCHTLHTTKQYFIKYFLYPTRLHIIFLFINIYTG